MHTRRQLLNHSRFVPASVTLALAAPWLILPRKSWAQQSLAGTVQRTEGFVRLVGANERTATAGSPIFEGDRLITTPNSDCVVKLNDGAVIAVRANSEMQFAQQRFNARDPADSSSVMDLVRGALRQVTGLIAKTRPTNVRVQTATATIGVRGTDFETVQIDQQSVAMGTSLQPGNYTQVYSGRTLVEGRGSGRTERVEVAAGQTSFSPDRSFGASSPFGLMQNVPNGVFRGGRFDGQLGGVQRQMMQEINNQMRESLPPELQRLMPEFGVTPLR